MTHRPRILGHVYVSIIQQRELAAGATFDMPLKQFRDTIKWQAHVGDLAWVKEPWCMLMPMGLAVPGHFMGLRDRLPPEWQKKHFEAEFKPTGLGLHRRESRFTLEVTGYDAAAVAVRFLVHQRQIDHLVEERRAA